MVLYYPEVVISWLWKKTYYAINQFSVNIGVFVMLCKHNDVIKWKHFPCHWPLWGKSTSGRWVPPQMLVTRSFDVFFDLRLNTRLS